MALRKIGRFFLETFIWNDQDHFLQAVTDGNAYQVQRLLNTGKNVDLEARYSDGFTPLMAAIEHGHLGVAELLLDSGANVDARNNEGETALHCAVRTENPGAVQLLLSYGAKPTARDQSGATPHVWAALLGAEDIFAILGPVMAESESHLEFLTAAATGRLQTLERMLQDGVGPDTGAVTGFTALLAASYNNQEEAAGLLLERGADANIRTRNGPTALMLAAERGNKRLLQLLLSKGARPGARDGDGLSARDYAESEGHMEAVALLDAANPSSVSSPRNRQGVP